MKYSKVEFKVSLLSVYSCVTRLLHYVMPVFLRLRIMRGKEDRLRYREKMGIYAVPPAYQPSDFKIHIHGASVGETLSAVPIIKYLLDYDKNIKIIVTSGTKTSADILQKILPDRCKHYYAAVDTPQGVNRFFDAISPDMMMIIDSEIWPHHLITAKQRNIPVFAINMRFSEKSQRNWKRFSGFFSRILSCYNGFFVQNDNTAEFIRHFSDATLRICPNLKWANQPEFTHQTEYNTVKSVLKDKKIITFLSTHAGEEKILYRALSLLHLQKQFLLVIVPRHSHRGGDIISDLKPWAKQNVIHRRSTGQQIDINTHIYIADTMNEVSLWTKLSDIVIMGKSFSPHQGGHNPIEPAFMQTALIFGKNMQNFSEITAEFLNHHAALQAENTKELEFLCKNLLDNPHYVHILSKNAYDLCLRHKDNALRFLNDIIPYLPVPSVSVSQ